MSKSVAIIFTDLVGSTALATRLGPEKFESLRIEHFELLRGAARNHGARDVKSTGDGLMLVSSTVSAALSAGVAMQQAIDAHNRASISGEPMTIRVGVSTGEVDEVDDDFYGPSVVEAARLCDIGTGGQVLTSALVKLYVGARGGFTFDPLGEFTLKGFIDPVDVFAVAWVPLPLEDASAPPDAAQRAKTADLAIGLPQRLVRPEGAFFAGRAAEQVRWKAAWKHATAGEQRLWLLGGEAGIGKTTLLSHLAAIAHDNDALVLYGRCDEDLGVPYQPWIEALTPLIAQAPDSLIASHVSARGGELARLIPSLGQRAPVAVSVSADPVAERYALFGAVSDVLRRAAAHRPILLVLDDLHWADKPTVQLIRHLASSADGIAMMIVASYRPTDISASHPLAESFSLLHRCNGVEFVGLAGLDDRDLLDLMEAAAGHELDADGIALRDAIAAETNGNAFFVTEILRHLAESGATTHLDGRWRTADSAGDRLPMSIRHVVGERVLRLGREAQRLLTVAAVIGRDFDLGLLAEVGEVADIDALDVLDSAVAASLLWNVGPDRYTFAHALVEHSLYDELTPSRAGRLHRRVATALEARYGDDPGERIGELAHHWSAAMAIEDASKALDYSRRAGDRALLQLAPDEALRWYSQALELHKRNGGAGNSVAILVGLGTAQRQVGDPAHRETLIAAAAEALAVGDNDGLIAAVFANHRGFASSTLSTDDQRLSFIEAALTALGQHDSEERARLLAILAAELTYGNDTDRRLASAHEAVDIARRIGDPRTLLATLLGLNTSLHVLGLALCDEAVELAQRLDDNVSLVSAAATMVTESLGGGDRASFDRAIEVCVGAAERIGQPTLKWRAMIGSVMEAIVRGDLTNADQLASQHVALGIESGQPDALILYSAMLATIRHHQGRMGELGELIELSVPDNPDVAMIRSGLLLVHLANGDLDKARVGFDREAADGFSTNDDALRLTYLCMMALVCARLDDRAGAESLIALIEPRGNQIETTAVTAFCSTTSCLGMLAAVLDLHDVADRWFAEALDLTTNFGFPYLVAVAQVEWARALLRRATPDVGRADAMLNEALGSAKSYGFAGVERDAVELLNS